MTDRERYLKNERQKRWRAKHPGKALAYVKKWQSENREKHLEQRKALRLKHRLKENARTKRWREGNMDKVRAYARKHRRDWMANDLNFAIRERIRGRIKSAIAIGAKSGSSMKLLGCSIESFKLYIESKFEAGMTWGNWGYGRDKWNIDHIMPLSIFDLTKPEHQNRAFHFSNLQPMWQPDNFKKKAKIISDQFNLL